MFSTLPELELVWRDAIAAPPVRARHVACGDEPLGGRSEQLVEHLTALDRRALARRVHADSALERPRREVRVRLGGGHLLDEPVNPHLPIRAAPEKKQARAVVLRQVARL